MSAYLPDLDSIHRALDDAATRGSAHTGMTDIWRALDELPLADQVLLVEDGFRFPNLMTDGYLPEETTVAEVADGDDLVSAAAARIEAAGGTVCTVPVGALRGPGAVLVPAEVLPAAPEVARTDRRAS